MAARTRNTARPKGMITRDFKIIEVDPRTLVLDPCNVRDEDVKPTQEMLASVAQDGVDTPVIIRPLTPEQAAKLTVEGKPAPEYGVLAGQQRWLSSIEAANKAEEDHTDWFALPCVVREDLKGADQVAITRSFVENHHRKAMTASNTARTVAQLAAFPMTPTQRKKAAQSTGFSEQEFKSAKAAVALDTASFAQATDHDFDLYQTAQYGEVKDVRGALNLLHTAAGKDAAEGGGYGHWEHAMAKLRREQQVAQERAAELLSLQEAKVRQFPRHEMPSYDGEWAKSKMRPLSELVSGMGNPIDKEQHLKDCPGHAYYLTYGNEAVHVCIEWKKNNHRLSPAVTAKTGLPASNEESKARNRLVRENNEAFKTATSVRQAAQKAALKEKLNDASWALIRRVAARMPSWYAKFVTNPDRLLLAQLLGGPQSLKADSKNDSQKNAAAWLEQAEARMGTASSGKLLLAQIFAAYEARVMNADKVWENPNMTQVEVLIFMRDHLAYRLSETEAAMVAHATGETAAELEQQEQLAPAGSAVEQAVDGPSATEEPGLVVGDAGEAESGEQEAETETEQAEGGTESAEEPPAKVEAAGPVAA